MASSDDLNPNNRPADAVFRLEIQLSDNKRITREFFKENLTIGRQDTCGLILQHKTVSKEHALIIPAQAGYTIRDTDSANGIYLNGKRIKESPLTPGDRLRIGKFELIFLGHLKEAPPPPPRPAEPEKSKKKRRKKRKPKHLPPEPKGVIPPKRKKKTPRERHKRKYLFPVMIGLLAGLCLTLLTILIIILSD